MHPALSVIFFTTLSGMGYGLWIWLGLLLVFAGDQEVLLSPQWLAGLIAGGILAAIGLMASFLHLGKPLRAWRAFSQWRTSWLSREGVLAVASFFPAGMLMLPGCSDSVIVARFFGSLLAVLAVATVICTAMIYASLKPVPAWRHRFVVPVYLAFALWSGGLAFWPLTVTWNVWRWLPWLLMVLALLLMLAKWIYWRAIDSTPLPQTTGDAVGLPQRRLSVFEQPHTEANYITREMGFVLARRHACLLRSLTVALLVIAVACLFLPQSVTWWLLLPAICGLASAFVERWLFFAQARHMVMLYY